MSDQADLLQSLQPNGVDKPKKAAIVNLSPQSDEEEDVEVKNEDGRESNEGLLDAVPSDIDDIDLSHARLQSLDSLNLERFTHLQSLSFRQNLLKSLELPLNLITLKSLDVYDNLLHVVPPLSSFINLVSLDLSFNKIKVVEGLDLLVNLKELFFVQNRVSKIEGVDKLVGLTNLEFGANKIRKIEGLDSLTNLTQLWLGKNKISSLTGLNNLPNLDILSIQSNRITQLERLELSNLTEMYLSHNGIAEIPDGVFSGIPKLKVLDISANKISKLNGFRDLPMLEELWASYNQISDFKNIQDELTPLEHLTTVYFEHNPVETENKVVYRSRLIRMLPMLMQIDATLVRA